MNERKETERMPEGTKCHQCGALLPVGALAGLCPACLLKQGAATDTHAGSQASDQAGPNGTKVIETSPPPSVIEVAKLFPQLEILGLIGQGGMGAVYQARQPALDRLVALKILPPQGASGPAFSDRFTREARALARLNHPSIVAVYDFGQMGSHAGSANPVEATLTPPLHHPMGDGDTNAPGERSGPAVPLHYFIMEFIDGVNLRQLEQSGKLSPHQALQIIPQICDALQYAHSEGVVHRDIKPENVLIDRKGRVKIADFGLAKILGHETSATRLTGEGQVMGTPHYMAPEQIERPLQVDHRADIYSLGVVFYEMLTGELPLGRFAPPSQKVQVDVRLDEVVLHALEKEPMRRYQQASEVKTDVEAIATSAPSLGATTEPRVIPSGTQTERLRWLIVAAGFILCVGAAVMGFNSPPLLGIPTLIWGILGFVLATAEAIRSGTSPEQDRTAIRAARRIILVDGIGLCLVGLLLALTTPVPARAFAVFVAVMCGVGIVVCVLRLLGIEPLRGALLPHTWASLAAPALAKSLRTPKRFTAAVIVAITVFVVTLFVAARVTFLLPKTYVGTARISTERGTEPGRLQFDPGFMQVQIARINSEAVLGSIVSQDVEFRHQMKRAYGEAWSDSEALQMLRSGLVVTQTRNTSLLEIRYYAETPGLAAEVANRIAEVYCSLELGQRGEIIDRAVPSLRPVRPNVPLNLTIGAVAGLLLGLLAGVLTILIASRGRRKETP
jgi:serine/threonine protein kinase/capsular polysaccharide biosynthesis protein